MWRRPAVCLCVSVSLSVFVHSKRQCVHGDPCWHCYRENALTCEAVPALACLVQITSWSITHRALFLWRTKLLAAMFLAYFGCSLADFTSRDESNLCFRLSLNAEIWWTDSTWLDFDAQLRRQIVFFLCQSYYTASMCWRWSHIQDFQVGCRAFSHSNAIQIIRDAENARKLNTTGDRTLGSAGAGVRTTQQQSGLSFL